MGVDCVRNRRWAQLKDHELDCYLALVGAAQYRVDQFHEALPGLVDLRLTTPELHGERAGNVDDGIVRLRMPFPDSAWLDRSHDEPYFKLVTLRRRGQQFLDDLLRPRRKDQATTGECEDNALQTLFIS
jgi:hypothetical protein